MIVPVCHVTPSPTNLISDFSVSSGNRNLSVMQRALVYGKIAHDAGPARRSASSMQDCPMLRSILRPNVLMLALLIIAVIVAATT
jgi:hypothetical protein